MRHTHTDTIAIFQLSFCGITPLTSLRVETPSGRHPSKVCEGSVRRN